MSKRMICTEVKFLPGNKAYMMDNNKVIAVPVDTVYVKHTKEGVTVSYMFSEKSFPEGAQWLKTARHRNMRSTLSTCIVSDVIFTIPERFLFSSKKELIDSL